MEKIILHALVVIITINFLSNAHGDNQNLKWFSKTTNIYVLHYTENNSGLVDELASYIDKGIETIEKYFGEPFVKKFHVYVFPSRQSLEKQWSKDWGIQNFKSECWMVASGVANRLDLLSPAAWKTEACEHNSENNEHVQKLITHELVHVYHGQHNPVPDFAGMDDLGWFVEGIAVLVSGQLDSTRTNQLIEAKEQNKLPAHLKNAWSGKYRYTVCGSIADFIARKYGRKVVLHLLECSNEEQVMKLLETNEAELLSDWTHGIVLH